MILDFDIWKESNLLFQNILYAVDDDLRNNSDESWDDDWRQISQYSHAEFCDQNFVYLAYYSNLKFRHQFRILFKQKTKSVNRIQESDQILTTTIYSKSNDLYTFI